MKKPKPSPKPKPKPTPKPGYYRNPISGEIKLASGLAKASLIRYGWLPVSSAEHRAWQLAIAERLVNRFVSGLRLH